MALRRVSLVSVVFTLAVFCSLECTMSDARTMTKPHSKRLHQTNDILSQSSEESNEATTAILGQSIPEPVEHDWVQIIDSPGDIVAKEGTNEEDIGNSVNDNMIPEYPRHIEGASGRTFSRLLVPCVTLLDGVSYRCIASANGHKVEASIPLSVVPRKDTYDDTKCLQETILSSKLQRPYIVLHNSMMLQTIGMTVELACRVLKSGSLVISPLKWVDMGQYTCTAENNIGQDSTITFLYPMAND
ncbi:hypothetical protein B566_EDAN017443 [Ephemera danica]|nr:hypothetical protein B566_EDAN017443 [Ephemera danica]